MSNEAANVDLLKAVYSRWHDTKGGNVADWLDLAADDFTLTSLAGGAAHAPFTETCNGCGKLQGYFDGLLKDWEMIHYTPHEFVAQGDVVVMRGLMAWRNKNTKHEFESPKIDFWRFRNGKAVEFFEYYDTAGVQAAATP